MRTKIFILGLLLLAISIAGGCAKNTPDDFVTVRVWAHQGQEAENEAMRAIATSFNAAHKNQKIRVELTFFPDSQYSEKISIAAAGRDLPDVLEIDGPLVARYVSAGLLHSLEPWFDAEAKKDFLPSIIEQGTIDENLYALGAFDSALVLYYDRSLLARAGVLAPRDGAAWTWEEFLAACKKLKSAGIEPVALHMNESADEWFTYAFSPVLWSAGGDLIDVGKNSVRGVLASESNVHALQAWQTLFQAGYAATAPVEPDPFGRGDVAMDWSGHWMARSHLKIKGDQLGAMPLPMVGANSVAACGSWCWGISSASHHPELAAKWLRWVTDRRQGIGPIVRAGGAVPANRSAFADFPEYNHDPYHLFREQLEHHARPRPRTPHYAVLTQRFAAALRDISRGADVKTRLISAEDEIQRVIDERSAHIPGKRNQP